MLAVVTLRPALILTLLDSSLSRVVCMYANVSTLVKSYWISWILLPSVRSASAQLSEVIQIEWNGPSVIPEHFFDKNSNKTIQQQTWLIEEAEAFPLGAVIVRTPSLLMLEETLSPFTPVGKVNFCSKTRVLKLKKNCVIDNADIHNCFYYSTKSII